MTTAVEDIKGGSNRLRGDLADELIDGSDRFSAESGQLLKFHGIYQQDDRDVRRARKTAGDDLDYSCMVRCSVPGGVLDADQWLAIDALADEVSDGSLRLTTRQGVQYHFVHKGDLHQLIGTLNRGLVTTYAACGDVVRNIMVTPAPDRGRDLDRLHGLADRLAAHFQPASAAYWELWVDGEKAVSAGPAQTRPTQTRPARQETDEPIYGATYLPRKFKMGIAWPGDNSIDVYSQDLGIVPLDGPDGPGAVVLAGGGLGRSHKDETTFPRLAEPLAWVPDHQLIDVVEAVVTTFRDEGDRTDRSHARLKYLIEERGIAWLRTEVEQRTGHRLADPLPLPDWDRPRSSLGWHRQDGGRWYLGIAVPSGRLTDSGGVSRRRAIRTVVERFGAEVRLTPHQDLLLCGIDDADRVAIDAIMADHGVPRATELPLTVISSMACPALPTCGQALGEAERVLPEVTGLLDQLLGERGLGDVRIETRMTGCPNGCARPYVAELGIVGRTKTAYDIFVGGDPAGTRLATAVVESVPLQKLSDVLQPLLDRFRSERVDDEAFGQWANRVGVDALAADLPTFGRSRR
jgi:sulfite reductase (ferredoxin)